MFCIVPLWDFILIFFLKALSAIISILQFSYSSVQLFMESRITSDTRHRDHCPVCSETPVLSCSSTGSWMRIAMMLSVSCLVTVLKSQNDRKPDHKSTSTKFHLFEEVFTLYNCA